MHFTPKHSQGMAKNFLKLAPGESVTGVFRGEIYEFYAKWANGKSTVTSEGDGSFRFRINFICKENGALVSKIWEQGTAVYNQLAELHSEYDLTKTFVKITRNGQGTQTTYTLLPILKQKVDEKQIAAIALQELSHKSAQSVPIEEFEDVPF